MKVFVGYDPREVDGFIVTACSIILNNASCTARVKRIDLQDCRDRGLYWRPTSEVDGKLYDDISEAPMATEFAISRFLLPWLADEDDQWVLFMDCDMLVRSDVEELMQYADPTYAVQCIQHEVVHEEGLKMDGCVQTHYNRKNWSSVMLWNLKHPAHKRLTLDDVNLYPGRDLHQFYWLEDDEIGELPATWNHLVGINPPAREMDLVHYTLGIPSMSGYETCEYATEWRNMLKQAIDLIAGT